MDGQTQAGSGLLDQAFPVANPRFPAVSLDEEVLGDSGQTDTQVEDMVRDSLPHTPPSLLLRLANSVVERCCQEATPSKDLRKWTEFILQCLVQSDRPELATDLIKHILLDSPGDTSWHRIVLHAGIIKKLPPVHAKSLILDPTDGVVVPIAAELNERSPMTEDRWELAEQACEPPEVYDDGDFAPICAAVVRTVTESCKVDSLHQLCLVQRILIPLTHKSRENNTRWVRIFLRKYRASQLSSQIPESPCKPQLLHVFLTKHTAHMPAVEFANLSDLLSFAGRPSEDYKELAEKLKEHPEAYKQKDAHHWLRVTNGSQLTGSSRSTQHHGIVTRTLLTAQFSASETAVTDGLVTPLQLQDHERRVLDLLADFPLCLEAWKAQTATYEPPLDDKSSDKRRRWRQYCLPLVQHAVSLV